METKLNDALLGIGSRSDEIVAGMTENEHELASVFSLKENLKTIDLCMAVLAAVADSSPQELLASQAELIRARDRVMAANAALTEQATKNPLVMSLMQMAESAVFDALLAGDADMIVLARLMQKVRLTVRIGLQMVFAELRRQLGGCASAGGARRGVQTPFMRKQRGIFAKYLEQFPVTPSMSIITRAHQCWIVHKAEWDRAAAERVGYSDYKKLARAI